MLNDRELRDIQALKNAGDKLFDLEDNKSWLNCISKSEKKEEYILKNNTPMEYSKGITIEEKKTRLEEIANEQKEILECDISGVSMFDVAEKFYRFRYLEMQKKTLIEIPLVNN